MIVCFYQGDLPWVAPSIDHMEQIGIIPAFLSDADPRPAIEQFNDNYAHGGGWHDFNGFELHDWNPLTHAVGDAYLSYPGDPPYPELARCVLHDELVIVFAHAWVAVARKDETYRIARLD
jgi:hypothetical protein